MTPNNIPAAKPLTATQRLTRQDTYTRAQMLPHNFTPWLMKQRRAITEATTIPLFDLIAMLDRDYPEGAHFVVVSKASTRSTNVTTVLDVQAKKFYRAKSETGLVSFWKGVARRRPAVRLLEKGESFSG